MSTVGAVVSYAPENGQMKWKYEQIPAPRQPKEGELLIRMAAVGICHTDIFVANIPEGVMGIKYPKVLGHEGAGYVEAVGSGVTSAAVGDPVLLSYSHCGSCDLCKEGSQTYCENFGLLNVVGDAEIYKNGPVGKFFGQSSFAAMAVVNERGVVNVKDSIQTFEELKRCAPMGCGLMTGAGAAFKHLKSHDILLVVGLGAVGMGAVMAAKEVGIRAIIAVDLIDLRLEIAKEVGATHTYNASDKDQNTFVEDIRALVDGQRISYAIETTGIVSVVEKATLALGKRGRMIQIGIPSLDAKVNLSMADFYHQNKIFEVNYLGDSLPQEVIPRMVDLYKRGRFPIDKFVHFYHVDKFEEALEAMKTKVVKPVLVF